MILYYNILGEEIEPIFEDSDIGSVLTPDNHYKIEEGEWYYFINQNYIPVKDLDETLDIIKHIIKNHKENIRLKKLNRIIYENN